MNVSFNDLSGGYRAHIAYLEPPMALTGKPLGLVVTTSLLLIGVTLFVALRVLARVLTRSSEPHGEISWGYDDLLVVFGFVSNNIVTIFTAMSALYGVGRHDDELNDFIKLRALEYQFYWQVCIAFPILFARWAIVTTLFGLTKGSRHVPQLWLIFAFSAMVFIWNVGDDIATCDPISATWNPALGTCSHDRFLAGASGLFASSVIAFTLDISCVWIAWSVLQRYDFQKQARWALYVIFGLAVYASIAPLARFQSFDAYDAPNEELYKLQDIMVWSNIEGGVALIVISVPSLARLSMGYFGERSGALVHKHRKGTHEPDAGDHIQDTIEFYNAEWLYVGDTDKLPMSGHRPTKQDE
ncbi:hypothetical protein PG996_001944 [Apiospora saccharicola]|uniref:Rhodopsin domain-containing protein n=1 Tax=Apiospora saccharicola TaxID=335842 RepID=A0ABR1WMB3_9PEZI